MKNIRKCSKLYISIFLIFCFIFPFYFFVGCGKCEHIESSWILDSEATTNVQGSQHTSCEKCGKVLQTKKTPSLNEIKNKLSDSIVIVYVYDYNKSSIISQGSGFFIDENGTFITNAHVVEDCFYIKVKYKNLTCDVKYLQVYNSSLDYAICKIDSPLKTIPVEFSEEASTGDTVFSYGFPNGIASFSKGKIISTSTIDGPQELYETTAKTDHGSSGGILSDHNGKVLGITTGMFDNGNYATLKYSEFKEDIITKHTLTRTPLSYFHTVKEVNLYSFNFNSFFDVYIQKTHTTDTSANYLVSVALKSIYANKKFLIDSFNINISLKLTTTYSYYEKGDYFDLRTTKTDIDYPSFYFYNETSLVVGSSLYSYSSIYLSSLKEYYGMTTTYDIDTFSVMGTILIFD